MTTRCVASSLVLSIALLGGPSLALAQGGGMAGMSHMDMGHDIVIPKGAPYTMADVEFMQGMIALHAQAIVMSRIDTVRGLTFINSDLAFGTHYAYQGNLAGFAIWDVTNPAKPAVVSAVDCITSHGDPSIVGSLLFISAEGADPKIAYIYVSGQQAARPAAELAGCNNGRDPVPGRDLYVQGCYQGGIGLMDFTDADHPTEIAYFDRGPIDPASDTSNASARSRYTIGGSRGADYWNGMIYSSELDRGFDVYELTPSPQLSANEIAAAKLVTLKEYNPQSQPKIVWPAAFPVVRCR